MEEVIWATPLYEFLRQSSLSSLHRTVLDCGAGGSSPPLSLFHRHGYRTCGLEIAEAPLAEAKQFCQENQMFLNTFRGDMRRIPFADESFGFVYSYNAIFYRVPCQEAVGRGSIRFWAGHSQLAARGRSFMLHRHTDVSSL